MQLLFLRWLIFISCLIRLTHALRAQKASRKVLNQVKALLNDDAVRRNALIQSDGIDPYADVVRNPKAKRNHDELAVNDPDEYFQGDVDLSIQQVNQIENALTGGTTREKRKIGRAPLYLLWDRTRPISFDFAPSIPTRTRHVIRNAMRLWQRHTCIRFEEGGPNVDRLEFFDGGGCSSFVGKVGGTQGISISTPGCDIVGIASHEIGHSLGLFHEQARPDQDHYININYNNIPLNRWNNFQAVHRSQAETYGLPFDTGSVMHYGPYGFASDPYVPTIRTMERTHQSTIGQRAAGPSFLDFQAINLAYGCTNHCPPINCLRNGYANPNNCTECFCPDGITGQFCGQIRQSNADCGGLITANKGFQYINSPRYPDAFDVNAECFWMIQAPPGGRVFLEFIEDFDFICEDTCDKSYVEIRYHNDKRLTGARLCCSSKPTHQFISFDHEMIVIMRGFGGTSLGFKARFWSDKGEAEATTIPPPTLPPVWTPPPPHPTQRTRPPTTLRTTTTTTTTTTTARPTTTTTIAPIFVWTPPTPPVAPPTQPTPPPFIPIPHAKKLVPTTTTTMQPPDVIASIADCGCGDWSEWTGDCSQECGGCGHRIRTRTCQKESCRKEEKRVCNFKVCPDGTNFLINNGEFHILWRGCCVGLFRSGGECSALENDQNPFLKIISSLLSIQDSKNNRTDKVMKIPRGEH